MITADDLPNEVVRKEIFTRLPIKSVVRFKCVAKSWLSLFSDPVFVKEHHTRSVAQNPNDHDYLIANKSTTRIVMLSRYKETFLLPSEKVALAGSIRGLVCLSYDNKFSFWNPAIHQSKEFTVPLSTFSNANSHGLSFDSASKEYKVVVVSDDKLSAAVYCSHSDSWIHIFVPEHVFPKNGIMDTNTPTTIVKDCPYWTFSRHLYDGDSTEMQSRSLIAVMFDAGSNEFKLMPEFYFDHGTRGIKIDDYCYKFVDMEDRFTVMVHNVYFSNGMIDIYSLVGEEGCSVWTKMFSVGPIEFYTRKYMKLSQGFKYGGEILFHDESMFSCYDHISDTIQLILGTPATSSTPISCFRYTPTLVFIRGMKSVYLTTQSRAFSKYQRMPRRLISSLKE